jgi:aldose 1-epimerase
MGSPASVVWLLALISLGGSSACSSCPDPLAEAPVQPATAAPSSVAAPAAPVVVAPPPAAAAPGPAKDPPITKAPFGKADGKDVILFTLKNQNGLVLKASSYGATITELHVPDRTGKLADVALGFETLEGYTNGKNPYMGVTAGRVANRIRGGKFKLAGKDYQVAANDKPHHLHGGNKGWDKQVWDVEERETPEGPALHFSLVSKDGDEGYPGTVSAHTTYTLTNKNELRVEMTATTDKTTLVNMAHHSYWNLAGFDSGTILDHELTLFATEYTPGDPMVPTGQIKKVAGTPFDFTTAKPIGRDLEKTGGKPIGYDHNFVVSGEAQKLRPVARLKDPKSGRVLTLEGDQPGVQFYSGNFLDGSLTGKGAKYAKHAGLCLETQKFPNAINVPAWQNQVILEPGQVYKHVMIHRFSAE